MNNLKAKLKKQGGFTLVEMLIVVAIIAILIAVSIPLVNNALERARHATDAANERAAKAEILICYLADTGTTVSQGDVFYYDAVAGKLETDFTKVTGYGKHDSQGHGATSVIALSINTDDEVVMQWTSSAITGSVTAGNDLCSAATDVDHS